MLSEAGKKSSGGPCASREGIQSFFGGSGWQHFCNQSSPEMLVIRFFDFMNTTTTTVFHVSQVGRYQKDKPFWIFWSRDDGVAVALAGPYHMQVTCTLLQTDDHASSLSLQSFMCQMLILPPNQQHQNSEGFWFCEHWMQNTWQRLSLCIVCVVWCLIVVKYRCLF